jgi:hypothetical protein
LNRLRLAAIITLWLLAAPNIPGSAAGGSGGRAQDQEEQDPAKAAELIRNAIQARGGQPYLNIKAMVSKGEYTLFDKGVKTLPDDFLDYIVYPDKERTEFGKGGRRKIQTNSGDSGWTYDAETRLIKDQTEQQIKEYQQSARYDLDNLLRRGWKEPGAKLVYLGRREVWKDTFSEAVRIDFSDGASATIHFDTRARLPLAVEFKIVGEDKPRNEQVRYYQWLDYDGVKFPKIQDTYRDGVQTSRAYYDSISVNPNVPARLFDKPVSAKEVK